MQDRPAVAHSDAGNGHRSRKATKTGREAAIASGMYTRVFRDTTQTLGRITPISWAHPASFPIAGFFAVFKDSGSIEMFGTGLQSFGSNNPALNIGLPVVSPTYGYGPCLIPVTPK